MSTTEILEKLQKKQTLTLNRSSCIRVQRVCVDEESLRQECQKREIPIRVELGMLVIG